MALPFLKHKWQKVTLIGVAAFVVLLFGVAFFINRAWSPILSSKVKKAVSKATGGLYIINFSAAEVRVLEGKILLYNIDLKIDSAIYKRRLKQGLAPNNLVELKVKRLILSHIHPFKIYFSKIVDIDRITLNQPDVHLSYQLNHKKDTLDKDHRTVWQKISKSLKYIHVGDIFLNDAKFKYTDYTGKQVGVTELKDVNIQVNDLLIDSLTQTDTTRFLYCKDVVADINNYQAASPDGLYNYAFKRAKFSTLTSQLKVQDFKLTPTANYFAKTHKVRYTIKLDSVILNRFDFKTYNKYRSFSASNLIIHRGSFDIFANPNGRKVYKDKIESFPHVALYQVDSYVKLDTLQITKLDVSYSEYNKKSQREGTITFNRTNANFYNISNDKTKLQTNNLLTAHINSHFMDRAKFNVDFSFNLTDKMATFSYKGHLGPLDLRRLNAATVPFAMVRITSGTLKRFDFEFNANRNVFKGKETLLYNDLKVNVLKNDTANQQLKKKFIVSIFANLFILKHNNPDKPGDIPRSFNVNHKRPIDDPFFKTVWKSMLAGIKPAVGFDDKTQRSVTARISAEQQKKKNRQLRKERRKAEKALKERREKAEKKREKIEKAVSG